MNFHQWKRYQDTCIYLCISVSEPGILSWSLCLCGLPQQSPEGQGEDNAKRDSVYEFKKKKKCLIILSCLFDLKKKTNLENIAMIGYIRKNIGFRVSQM